MPLATLSVPSSYDAGAWPAAIASGAPRAEMPPMTATGGVRLGVIMALRAEADCLPKTAAGHGSLTRVTGGSALRARAAAEQLVAAGVAGLVSFGLAVGLAPILRPGDVVIADRVVLPGGGTIATDAEWRAVVLRLLSASGLNVRVARLAGRDDPPLSASAKRHLFQVTFAAALDTESHAVAEVAAAAGPPLLVVRAVAEPAETDRPPVAFAATDADGHARGLAMVGHLAVRPWEIPAAWRFTKNGRIALDALRQVAAIGPAPFGVAPV
jgi:adenosylhomocysteine nucleosidase